MQPSTPMSAAICSAMAFVKVYVLGAEGGFRTIILPPFLGGGECAGRSAQLNLTPTFTPREGNMMREFSERISARDTRTALAASGRRNRSLRRSCPLHTVARWWKEGEVKREPGKAYKKFLRMPAPIILLYCPPFVINTFTQRYLGGKKRGYMFKNIYLQAHTCKTPITSCQPTGCVISLPYAVYFLSNSRMKMDSGVVSIIT